MAAFADDGELRLLRHYCPDQLEGLCKGFKSCGSHRPSVDDAIVRASIEALKILWYNDPIVKWDHFSAAELIRDNSEPSYSHSHVQQSVVTTTGLFPR